MKVLLSGLRKKLIGSMACVVAAVVAVGHCANSFAELPTLESPAAPLLLAQAPAPAATPAKTEAVSEAERISRLQRAIDADQTALNEVQGELSDPDSEYVSAGRDFKKIDEDVEKARKDVQDLRADGKTDEADKRQNELTRLEAEWKLVKERFDLAIQERKAIEEKLLTLQKQLAQDQAALTELVGPIKQNAETPAAPTTDAAAPPAVAPTTPAATPAPPKSTPAAAEQPAAPAAAPSIPTSPLDIVSGASPAPAQAPPLEKEQSAELQKATAEAAASEAAAKDAEDEAKSIAERMEVLRKDIELERTLIETARKQADIAEQTRTGLNDDYRLELYLDPESSQVDAIYAKIQEVQKRFEDAREESRTHSSRLDELQSRYSAMQADQLTALRVAEEKRTAAENAKQVVAELQNPFTTRNILQWLINHGPRIILILLAMALAMWMARAGEKRIVNAMVARGGVGKRIERENRARTLVSVFQNAANVGIISGGTLMLLDSIGAPITALMGGAAVFGLAIAFGAQSLIKDYFYGFMILLEQQYTINDVIRIGDFSGMVERITLRMTVLRDTDGSVHFVPHGQINSTTNMTHGWSRALFELGVAYKENTDDVVQCIKEVSRDLRRDPKFAPMILEDLTMMGIDALGESAVILKFFIKTEPLKQWEVKREMLRRIKMEFDQRGIEIPYPHRTISFRNEAEAAEDLSPETLPRRHSA
jgi:small conductance mechanosensitive channel